jgi:protein PhnA
MDDRLPHQLSEEEMVAAEKLFPELAAKAGQAAYEEALEKAGAVMVADEDDFLVLRFRDGGSRVIRKLPEGKRVEVGMVLRRLEAPLGKRPVVPSYSTRDDVATPSPAGEPH